MKFKKKYVIPIVVIFASFVLFHFTQSISTPQKNEFILPSEETTFEPSDMPGYILTMQKCLICHSQDYIKYQPSTTNRLGWEKIVKKMKLAYKAPIDEQEIPLIVEYLTRYYGNEKMTSK